MLLKKVLLTIGLVLTLSSLAPAQVKFERKIHEGKGYAVEVTARMDQKLTILGMEIDSGSDTKTVVRSTVGQRDGLGQIRVQDKVESLMITVKAQGTEYVFDSANPEKTGSSPFEMLREVHKGLSRRVSTSVFDKDNKITNIEFDQDILNGLKEEVRTLVQDQLDVEKLKKSANEEADRFPATPVKKGDTWERTNKGNLGAGQTMTTTSQYTYEGEVEKNGRKLDKISTKVTAVEFAIENNPMGITVKSSDLKPGESKGEILYDRALGQAIETTSTLQIKGEMTLVINGMELPSKLDLKIESGTVRKE